MEGQVDSYPKVLKVVNSRNSVLELEMVSSLIDRELRS